MNETKIKNTLAKQKMYLRKAIDFADLNCLESTARELTLARICKDEVYNLLAEIKYDEKGLASLTPEILQRMKKTADHPYAKETQKIYSQGESYCVKKLAGALC
jgi:hypothetical protein